MLRAIRKHNKWFMVAFGILLMVAWLVGPTMNQIHEFQFNRVVARLDGRNITAREQMQAGRELEMLYQLAPGVVSNLMGVEQHDWTHWLMLAREAEAAGYVGDTQDGADFADELVSLIAQNQLRQDFRFMLEVMQAPNGAEIYQRTLRERTEQMKNSLPMFFRQVGMTEDEGQRAVARAHGIYRMMTAYTQAARVSDRLAARKAREARDAAITDYVFIPASLNVDQIPDPDAAALQAHFDRYKTVRPGEGEYGIGYLFPARVKLEWITLSRVAFEDAVRLDPLEVRKRYTLNHPAVYPGSYAEERANVERDMRREAADRAMQEAQLAAHAEVIQFTKRLESDGKYKVLPPDWEQSRPRAEAIAQAIVNQVKPLGLDLPLPEVTIRANQWLTLDELAQLPGIGSSSLRQGGLFFSFRDVVSWTRELPDNNAAQGVVPVQIGIPLAEHPLTDAVGNRYIFTILATRGESPPDSVDQRRDQIVKDYKSIQAFERLKARADELRQLALSQGLDAVAAAVAPPPPTGEPAAEPQPAKPEVRKQAVITRERSGGDPNLDDPELRKALLAAAAKIDPLTPYGQADPALATVAIPTAKHLGLAIFRIQAHSPLTQEAYRAADASIVAERQQEELPAATTPEENPFSLVNLLKRHEYIADSKRITSVEDLKGDDRG